MTDKQRIINCLVANNLHSQLLIDTCLDLNEKNALQYLVWISMPEIKNNFIWEEFSNRPYSEIIDILIKAIDTRDATIKNQIIAKLDKDYNLTYVDYREDLSDRPNDLQKVFDDQSLESLQEKIWNWYEEQEWIDDDRNYDIIRDTIYDRNDSDPTTDILKNTKVNVRIELCSNYDIMPSAHMYSQTGYQYEDIFKQIVDALNLNPRKLQKLMQADWLDTGPKLNWPIKKQRDWMEFVKYEDFISELNESVGTCNHLTFMATLDCVDLRELEHEEQIAITIPAGNTCGLFDDSTWSWSMMECTLLRDFSVILKQPLDSVHDYYELYIDHSDRWYGIDEVYWMTQEVWGNPIKLLNLPF